MREGNQDIGKGCVTERKVGRRGEAQGWRRELGVTGVEGEQALDRKGKERDRGNWGGLRVSSLEGVGLNSSGHRRRLGWVWLCSAARVDEYGRNGKIDGGRQREEGG